MLSSAEFVQQGGLEGTSPMEALPREKDVQPICSVNDLACEGIFDTDRELEEFLTWFTAERRATGVRDLVTVDQVAQRHGGSAGEALSTVVLKNESLTMSGG